jgi:hypothetical protein
MKRSIEFITGVVIILFLLGRYNNKPIVAYITTNIFLEIIIIIGLLIITPRLIAGKRKDYSGFFYKLLIKFLGDPSAKRKDKNG